MNVSWEKVLKNDTILFVLLYTAAAVFKRTQTILISFTAFASFSLIFADNIVLRLQETLETPNISVI